MINPLIIVITIIAIMIIAYILIRRVCNKNTIGGMLTPYIIDNKNGVFIYDKKTDTHNTSAGVCTWITTFNIIGSNIEEIDRYVKYTIDLPSNIFTVADKKDIGKPLNKSKLYDLVKNWIDDPINQSSDKIGAARILLGRCYQLALWSGHTSYEEKEDNTTHYDSTRNDALYHIILVPRYEKNVNIYSLIFNALFKYALNNMLGYESIRLIPSSTLSEHNKQREEMIIRKELISNASDIPECSEISTPFERVKLLISSMIDCWRAFSSSAAFAFLAFVTSMPT